LQIVHFVLNEIAHNIFHGNLEFFHFSQFGTSQALDSLLEHGQSTLVYVYILFLSTRLGAVPLGARREHVVIPRTTNGRLLFTILLFQSSFMFGTLFSSPQCLLVLQNHSKSQTKAIGQGKAGRE
jgi:hypothetical protein